MDFLLVLSVLAGRVAQNRLLVPSLAWIRPREVPDPLRCFHTQGYVCSHNFWKLVSCNGLAELFPLCPSSMAEWSLCLNCLVHATYGFFAKQRICSSSNRSSNDRSDPRERRMGRTLPN